jgi:DNA-binding NarL/FixJ family response regulator
MERRACTAHPAGVKPIQVMIIDDHPGVRSLIRELLEDCFAAVSCSRPVITEFDSTEAALESLKSIAPDLATVDLRMSGMDGLECVRQLRQQVPGVVIVVVTSMQGESVAMRSVGAGADGVVFKDELTALQDLVISYLRRIPT